jgi:precorrin-8X/cobalt-precorrin-8 methylmutase
LDFLTGPRAIEAKSMEIIEEVVKDYPFPEKEIIKRVVHATGDPGLAGAVAVHPEAVRAAFAVFGGKKKIVTDVEMVRAGIRRLAGRFGLEVYCAVGDPEVAREAREQGLTRAMVAVRKLAGMIEGGLAVIGNAPTALFELVRMVSDGELRPALVVGTPVGFVGAAEAKRALAGLDVPYVTVHGTKGGSAVAASIVNALLVLWSKEAGPPARQL